MIKVCLLTNINRMSKKLLVKLVKKKMSVKTKVESETPANRNSFVYNCKIQKSQELLYSRDFSATQT